MLQISYTSSGWVKLTSTKSCQIKGWLPDISTLNVTEYSPSLPSPPSLLSLPRPLPPLPSPSLPHFFFKFFFLANRHFCTPAHAHKHYPTAVPANCLCVLRPASLGINLWCNHGYRTTGNYKISSIFNVPLIVFECVLMEKGIEEMKQCSLHEESGGWEPVSCLWQLGIQAQKRCRASWNEVVCLQVCDAFTSTWNMWIKVWNPDDNAKTRPHLLITLGKTNHN